MDIRRSVEMNQDKEDGIVEYFNKNKYVVIKGFLDKNTTTLFYTYCINKVKKVDFMTTYAKEAYSTDWFGQFGDEQAPGSYNAYGDDLMDTLLALMNYDVSIELTREETDNFAYTQGIDLPNYIN
jgi:hypothetical protein